MPHQTFAEIVARNAHMLAEGLTDEALDGFFQACFQAVIDDRVLYPGWMCLNCQNNGFGQRPRPCPRCSSTRVFEVATFQGRAPAVGGVFQEACKHILDTYFPEIGAVSSKDTPYEDHCDALVPGIAGIEEKGSPSHITAPNGATVEFDRPGMRRTDTEKKASSNASTFKLDFPRREGGREGRFYVLTNALPEDGWQEEHPAIDAIYDVTKARSWHDLAADIQDDRRRAGRTQLGRR